LEQLAQDVAEIKGDVHRLSETVARLTETVSRLSGAVEGMKGGFDQMDRRLSNLEQNQRWVLGLIFGTWITLMLTILFKG